MSLSTFKNFDEARLDLDELVALAAFGKGLRESYAELQVEEPDYVNTQLKTVKRVIAGRVADKREARKKELQARLESLKTPQERREAAQKELEALEALVS